MNNIARQRPNQSVDRESSRRKRSRSRPSNDARCLRDSTIPSSQSVSSAQSSSSRDKHQSDVHDSLARRLRDSTRSVASTQSSAARDKALQSTHHDPSRRKRSRNGSTADARHHLDAQRQNIQEVQEVERTLQLRRRQGAEQQDGKRERGWIKSSDESYHTRRGRSDSRDRSAGDCSNSRKRNRSDLPDSLAKYRPPSVAIDPTANRKAADASGQDIDDSDSRITTASTSSSSSRPVADRHTTTVEDWYCYHHGFRNHWGHACNDMARLWHGQPYLAACQRATEPCYIPGVPNPASRVVNRYKPASSSALASSTTITPRIDSRLDIYAQMFEDSDQHERQSDNGQRKTSPAAPSQSASFRQPFRPGN